MNRKFRLGCALLVVALGSGCASQSVEMVDTNHDQGEAVVGLDYRDFEKAASDEIQSLLASGAVVNPNGGRYVVTVSDVVTTPCSMCRRSC